MSFFDTYGNNGDIMNQVMTDVQVIQCALGDKVRNYIYNIAACLGGLVLAFIHCWQIAFVALATAPAVFAACWISNVFLHKFEGNLQDAYVHAANVAEEALSNVWTLYAFANEAMAKHSYASSLHDTLRYGITISLVQGLGVGFTYGFGMCSCALQLWVGRLLVTSGKSSGSEILTAIFAIILSGLGLNQASINQYSFEHVRIAAYRLYGVIRHSGSAADSDGNTLASMQGKIEFRNIFFSYPSCPAIPILNGFYLTVPAKKTVALVGRSGSGKSSLTRLLERHYEPNLVTSKLDLEAEKAVHETLNMISIGRSTIMIARRINLVKEADLIVVIEGGQSVEMGTHDELISSHGLYSELLRCEEVIKLPERLPSKNDNDHGSGDGIEIRSNSDHKGKSIPYSNKQVGVVDRLIGKYNNKHQSLPSVGTLVKLSLPDWLYAVLGSVGASIFGSLRPILAYVVGLILTAYYKHDASRFDVDKWCVIIACMAIVVVVATVLQHFYFGIVGEKMTERIRRMMFSAMLESEVGWFDKTENKSDNLLSLLANDATYVRAAFSNHLCILIQDFSAVFAAVVIGLSLEWRLVLVATVIIPFLTVSTVAQRRGFSGFSKGIEELHKKASVVLEDLVKNISILMAYCAGNETSRLYNLYLKKVYQQTLLHGILVGFLFGFSRFLFFACNGILLWYTAVSVRNDHIDLPTALREFIVFTFVTFALVEPVGIMMPIIDKRRKDLVRVFDIIDRVPKVTRDESTALKPVNAYGTIEFKNVNFCYPTSPEIMVLRDFTVKIDGGHTVGVVGVSGSGKSGVELTPGQKLRITIARVVLKNAPILLLDEADSRIEHESRRVVQEALDTLLIGSKTTILVARRESMMRRVDKVLVVNGGQIVESGTHDSLVANKNGVYAKLTQPRFVKGLRPHFLGSAR
ncbi:hypothetical protein R6Q57_028383 [Mikania cordata]